MGWTMKKIIGKSKLCKLDQARVDAIFTQAQALINCNDNIYKGNYSFNFEKVKGDCLKLCIWAETHKGNAQSIGRWDFPRVSNNIANYLMERN